VGAILRIPLAIVLVVAGAVYGHEHIARTVSVDGTVTGPLFAITAPIDGTVAESAVRIGDRVNAGQTLLRLTNPTADPQTLDRLMRDQTAKQAELTAVERRAKELENVREGLSLGLARYREVAIERLAISIEEVEAERLAAAARQRRAEADLARVRGISADHITKTRRDRSRAEAEVARASVTALDARLKRLRAELEAAGHGIFINDGFYETPYRRQRLDDVKLRLMVETARAEQLRRDLDYLGRQVAREGARFERLLARDVASPASGLVWNSFVGSGSNVRAGQVLAKVASCSDLFVEVALSESRIDRVSVDMPVVINLAAGPEGIPGRVRSIRGADAVLDGGGRTARIERRLNNMMTVTVAVAPEDLHRALNGNCEVGRSAEVYFDNRSLGEVTQVALEQVRKGYAMATEAAWSMADAASSAAEVAWAEVEAAAARVRARALARRAAAAVDAPSLAESGNEQIGRSSAYFSPVSHQMSPVASPGGSRPSTFRTAGVPVAEGQRP